MKKISPRQYAELLYELAASSKKTELAARVEQFLKLLVRGRALAEISRIIRAFDKLSDERAGIVRVKVTSARKLSRSVPAALLKALGAKELAWHECEDPEVIGGLRIEIENMIIDGTIKAQLTKLKNALIQ